MQIPRPVIKFPGGKTQLLPQLHEFVPKKFNRYYEPFFGGGALFFSLCRTGMLNMSSPRAMLSDWSPDVSTVIIGLLHDVEQVIQQLSGWPYDKEWYYLVRSGDHATWSLPKRAARVIYLNKTCFNGLHRVNKKGEFNVPFGKYTDPTICDEDNLRAAAACLRLFATYERRDFRKACIEAKRDDFCYLDSPYAPTSSTANFTAYTAEGFHASDHEDVAKVFEHLANEIKAKVMLSNADVPWVRERYANWNIHPVTTTRSINSVATKRSGATELIITSY